MIPESDALLAEDRNKHDKSVCEHFLNAFNVGFDKEDIRRVQRLGRRNEDFLRPILVQFGSRHIKNLIMESLYKIKSMDNRLQNIIVAHNLTKKNNGRSVKLWCRKQKRKLNGSQGTMSTESGDLLH